MRAKRRVSLILCVVMVISLIFSPVVLEDKVYGAGPIPLTIEQAEAWAFSYSSQYQTKMFRYAKLCKKYEAALKSVATKWSDYGTIRWSLLFGIDWPEYPYMDEAMDLYKKGPGIMTEINVLVRDLYDTKFEIKKKTDDLFIKAYEYQEKVAFNEKQTEETKKNLARNQNLLAAGQANPKDIENIEKSLANLEKEQANLLRGQMSTLKSMKNLTGVDVTTGYKLVNPLVTAKLDRVENLPDILNYSEYWNLEIYDSDLDVSLGKQNLNIGMRLLNENYGALANTYIQPHVSKILRAVANIEKNYEDLKFFNVKAFNSDYEQFLKAIDEPWQGNYKIWFIRIPKEWFKGKLDGIRYVENEQYTVLDAALQLKDDAMANQDLRVALRENVENTFNSVKDAESAYQMAVDAEKDAKETMEMVLNLNKIGEASYEETVDAQVSYETSQRNKIDSLVMYTELLYSLDRMSYGAITKLLKGESIKLQEGNAGISYADLTDSTKAYYFIQPLVPGLNFSFGVNIPENYEPKIDEYELWYKDNIQIGKRTSIDNQIVHLVLDYGDTNELEFRGFYGGEFVDKCKVDANSPSGEINFMKELPPEPITEKVVGTYSIGNTEGAAPVSTSIKLKTNKLENIASYTIVNDKDKPLINNEKIPIDTPFNYLTLIAGDVTSLKVKLFDKGGDLLYTARFKGDTFEIVAPLE